MKRGRSTRVPSATCVLLASGFQATSFSLRTLTAVEVEGKLPRDDPERCAQMFNDHPKFFNAGVAWLLRYSTNDAVAISAMQTLLPYSCDVSDPWIRMLHTQDMKPDALQAVADSMLVFMELMMLLSDVRKLGKVNEGARATCTNNALKRLATVSLKLRVP